MRRFPLLAALAALLSAACGTKGPLVLPPPKPQPAATAAPSAPAADNSSKAPGDGGTR